MKLQFNRYILNTRRKRSKVANNFGKTNIQVELNKVNKQIILGISQKIITS